MHDLAQSYSTLLGEGPKDLFEGVGLPAGFGDVLQGNDDIGECSSEGLGILRDELNGLLVTLYEATVESHGDFLGQIVRKARTDLRRGDGSENSCIANGRDVQLEIVREDGLDIGEERLGRPDRRWLGPMVQLAQLSLRSPFSSQTLTTKVAKRSKEDMLALTELIEAGKVMPVIDRSYTLSEVTEAMRYFDLGHAQGKVVIKV